MNSNNTCGSLNGRKVNSHSACVNSLERKDGEAGKDAAENLSFGAASAREIVLAWIIDDGIKNRSHRKNIFSPKFKLFGVACGKGIKNQTVCVAEFANTFRESKLPAGVIQVH